jgi:hypothetical protein
MSSTWRRTRRIQCGLPATATRSRAPPGLAERARRGEAAALPRLRALLDEHPEVWRRAGDLAAHVQAAWTDLLVGADPVGRESIQRRAEQLRRSLAGPDASAAASRPSAASRPR